jgi:hypothetical protein
MAVSRPGCETDHESAISGGFYLMSLGGLEMEQGRCVKLAFLTARTCDELAAEQEDECVLVDLMIL